MRYSEENIGFLRSNYPSLMIPDLTCAFNLHFSTALSEGQIKAACKNHKIKCGRAKGNPVGSYRLFTREEAQYLEANYKIYSLKRLTDNFNISFGKNIQVSQIRSFMRNHGLKSGRTGCFEKKHSPWNSGTKGQGLVKPNSGNFPKGNVPQNRKPIGSERIDSKDGYILVKVAEQDPYTGFPTRYRQKHVVVWEKENGPVPEGKVIAFKDGDHLNCAIDNLMLVSRPELLRLNKHRYSETPNQLKPCVLALAKLEVKTFDRLKSIKG